MNQRCAFFALIGRLWLFSALVVAGAGITVVEGCKQGGSGKPVIAVIPKGTSHEYWQSVKAGAEDAGRALNVEIAFQGTLNEDDHTGQIGKVQGFTADKVAGIVLAPQDATALVRSVQAAQAAGVPVVIFDSKLDGTPGTDYVSLVATDNEKAGETGGETLAKLMNYKGKVVLLRYKRGSASTDAREEGFLKIMKKYEDKGIKVISSNQEGDSTSTSARTKAMSMLDELGACDGIFCPNESTALGMLQALEQSGYAGKKKFVGFDQSEKLIEGLTNGHIDALIAQNPRKMGYDAVKAMVDHLNNKPVAAVIDTGSGVITRENLNTPEIQQLLK